MENWTGRLQTLLHATVDDSIRAVDLTGLAGWLAGSVWESRRIHCDQVF